MNRVPVHNAKDPMPMIVNSTWICLQLNCGSPKFMLQFSHFGKPPVHVENSISVVLNFVIFCRQGRHKVGRTCETQESGWVTLFQGIIFLFNVFCKRNVI